MEEGEKEIEEEKMRRKVIEGREEVKVGRNRRKSMITEEKKGNRDDAVIRKSNPWKYIK